MLENKLGLTSSAELAREEERISKKKAAMLFENHIFDNLESGKFSTLQTIHKYLFDEIYDLWRDFLNFPYFTGFPAP